MLSRRHVKHQTALQHCFRNLGTIIRRYTNKMFLTNEAHMRANSSLNLQRAIIWHFVVITSFMLYQVMHFSAFFAMTHPKGMALSACDVWSCGTTLLKLYHGATTPRNMV